MPVKQRLSSEQRRAAIVDAAIQLFSERGFRGATTRELAAAVGVTEPVLYAHFETKRDLYTEIIEAVAKGGLEATLGRELESALAAEDDHAFFRGLGEMVLEWYRKDPQCIRLLLYSALEGHELSDIFYERQVADYYRLIEDYLRRRIEHGAFRDVNPAIAARAFTGMLAHYGQSAAIFGRGCGEVALSDGEVVEGMVGIFLDGIRKPGNV
jgi:AcrR family transcriptional regulator